MVLLQFNPGLLPFLAGLIMCLCAEASYAENVRCWWYKVAAVDHNVSMECRADSHDSQLKCELCHLFVLVPGASHSISAKQCSHTNASFSMLVGEQEMQNVTCRLLCPGLSALTFPAQEGYPPPICLIPVKDTDRNIHCHWTHNPLNTTNFTLHWAQDDGHSGYTEVGPSDHGVIPRAEYTTHSHIRVWVSATNELGVTDSEAFETFTTENINQPATPDISSHTADPLEIFWNVANTAGHSGEWNCKVQYRKQCEQFWTEDDHSYDASFSLEDAVPFTRYTFRVRCWFVSDGRSSVSSDWSKEYSVETPAAAPVGKLDVWSDCEAHSDDSSCTILWKEFPFQLARGNISSYVLRVKLSNGSDLGMKEAVMDRSAEVCAQCGMQIAGNEPANIDSRPPRWCSQEQDQSCFHFRRLSVPVRDVKDVCVTVNTTLGESSPALVALPRTVGLPQPSGLLQVRGASQELKVSWSVPPRFSESVQEYVVQHKPVGIAHGPCLNWVRVQKNQTSVRLRGQLLNYTAYNVSLFAVVNNCSRFLKSAIAYTVEGAPTKVTDFHAADIYSCTVKLTWTPIPLNKSRGHILKYIVGLYNHTRVYNVTSNQSSIELPDLDPAQHYEAWICAVTSAGEGERTTVRFATKDHDPQKIHTGAYDDNDNDRRLAGTLIILSILFTLLIFVSALILVVRCYWHRHSWTYKIPDPINSMSFKQISNQLWHSWPGPTSSMERGLTISQVEVIAVPEPLEDTEDETFSEVQQQDRAELDRELLECREKEPQGSEQLERNDSTQLHKRNDYSQAIDSTDEDEDEDWNDHTCTSDYERHFMPPIVGT